MFSACVAAVKSRPVLHHCVVIYFWSPGIMECTCMLFTFKKLTSAHALECVSCVALLYPHHKMWGGLYWIRFVASVGRSVSNSCPLYNSFTNGSISFKLEWHIHLNEGMCRAHVQSTCCPCVRSRSRSQLKVKYLTNNNPHYVVSAL